MATKKGKIAAGIVTTKPVDPYSFENLFYYHVSLGLVETLVIRGILSRADFKKSCTILTKNMVFPKTAFLERLGNNKWGVLWGIRRYRYIERILYWEDMHSAWRSMQGSGNVATSTTRPYGLAVSFNDIRKYL